MPAPNVAPPLSVVGTDPWVQNRDALNALQQVVRNLPHNALPVSHNCPTDGVLALTSASVALLRVANTENPEDPYDDVRRINPTTLADGLTISIENGLPGTPVTLRHMSFAGAQVGELDLAGDTDVVLMTKAHRIVLQRRGNRVVEISRAGYATEGGGDSSLVQFNNDIDAGGFAVTNLARKFRDSASTTTTISTADRDMEVHISGSNVTLPTNPSGWRRGDTVILVQRGPDMIIAPAVNLVTPLNHDRGYGIGATVVCVVHDVSDPMKWRLGGLTKTGSASPPPTEITRVAVWVNPGGQTDTPAGSAAYVTAATLTHTCGAAEKWAYITGGKLRLSPSNITNQAHARMRKSTDASVGPTTMGARYLQGHEAVGFLNTRTYATADTHSFLLETFADIDPDTSASSTLFLPFILGIKLETDEHLAGTAATITPGSTTYLDVLSYSATFTAGDYLVLGWCEWLSSNAIGANLRLQIDGGNYCERTREKPNNALMPGNFSAMKIATLAAGTKVLKVQIALPTGATGTAQSQRAQIIALRKDKFEGGIEYADNMSIATTTSTTAVEICQVTKAWVDGFDYLIIANATLKNSLSAANARTYMQVKVGTANYGPEIQSLPHVADSFHPNSGFITTVFRGTGASLKVSLNYWAGGSTASTATIADAAIAVIALRRAT